MSNAALQDEDQEEVLEDKPRSILLHLIKKLSRGQDLTQVLIPTFFLEPRSLLERYTDLWLHPHIILPISTEDDPARRMLMVARWHISGWHIRPKGVKKPYNPLLGEIFRCYFDHGDSRTFYIGEQVSHHPPVSAFYLENRSCNIALQGHIHSQSKFLGNGAASIQNGFVVLYVTNRNEQYRIEFPTFYVYGLFFGKLRAEVGGEIKITCQQTQLTANLNYLTKPMIGGDYHRVRGTIVAEGMDKRDYIYSIEGKWDTVVNVTEKKTGETRVLFDASAEPLTRKFVAPLERQSEWESRRIWKDVTAALKKQDHDAATAEKTRLEEAQRQRKKEREEKKEDYRTKHFEQNQDGAWVYKNFNLSDFSATSPPANPDFLPLMSDESDAIDLPSASNSTPDSK